MRCHRTHRRAASSRIQYRYSATFLHALPACEQSCSGFMQHFLSRRAWTTAAVSVDVTAGAHACNRAFPLTLASRNAGSGIRCHHGAPLTGASTVRTAAATEVRRFQSSSSSIPSGDSGRGNDAQGSTTSSADVRTAGPSAEDQRTIDAAKPASNILEERLGFQAGDTVNEEQLKAHFVALAKHYHPDNPTAPPNATESFTRIREAYDELGKALKSSRFYTSHSGGGTTVDENGSVSGGPHYADEAARRARMRALGDGVMFFVLATILYLVVVVAHNRERLRRRQLLHFFGIFFTIQLLPRLLAATVLFAAHTGYLVLNCELTEQAAATLLVRQRTEDLHVAIKGIKEDCVEHTVVQVEVAVETEMPQAGLDAPSAMVVASTTTTLTMDPGVTSFTLPLPPSGQEARTVYKVKAVDERRKFVVLDKEFSLA